MGTWNSIKLKCVGPKYRPLNHRRPLLVLLPRIAPLQTISTLVDVVCEVTTCSCNTCTVHVQNAIRTIAALRNEEISLGRSFAYNCLPGCLRGRLNSPLHSSISSNRIFRWADKDVDTLSNAWGSKRFVVLECFMGCRLIILSWKLTPPRENPRGWQVQPTNDRSTSKSNRTLRCWIVV